MTTLHTKCLTFLVLELKMDYWVASTLPVHCLSVEHLVMLLYSARKVVGK